MCNLPGPVIKPVSPALAGEFLATGPSGKSSLPLFSPTHTPPNTPCDYLFCLLSVSAPLEHQRPFVSPTDSTSGHTDPTASDNPPLAAALLPGWAEGDGEQTHCRTSACPAMGEEWGVNTPVPMAPSGETLRGVICLASQHFPGRTEPQLPAVEIRSRRHFHPTTSLPYSASPLTLLPGVTFQINHNLDLPASLGSRETRSLRESLLC